MSSRPICVFGSTPKKSQIEALGSCLFHLFSSFSRKRSYFSPTVSPESSPSNHRITSPKSSSEIPKIPSYWSSVAMENLTSFLVKYHRKWGIFHGYSSLPECTLWNLRRLESQTPSHKSFVWNLQALWRLGGAKDGRTAIPNSTTYRAVHLRRRWYKYSNWQVKREDVWLNHM